MKVLVQTEQDNFLVSLEEFPSQYQHNVHSPLFPSLLLLLLMMMMKIEVLMVKLVIVAVMMMMMIVFVLRILMISPV